MVSLFVDYRLIRKDSVAISFSCFLNTNISRPLSGAMLEQVKLRRLSDIICENTDIATITGNVFIQVCALHSVQCILYNVHSKLKYQKKSSMCFFFSRGKMAIQRLIVRPIESLIWTLWQSSWRLNYNYYTSAEYFAQLCWLSLFREKALSEHIFSFRVLSLHVSAIGLNINNAINKVRQEYSEYTTIVHTS